MSLLQTSQPWSTEILELEAKKSGDFSKNLEIDYYLYFLGLRKNRWPFFGVERDKKYHKSFNFFEIRHFDLHQIVTWAWFSMWETDS